jgi:hypothetical protein
MPWHLGINARKTDDVIDPCDLHDYVDLLTTLAPVAYWKLNETSGSTAVDWSGNTHHGTYNAGVHLSEIPGNCLTEKYMNAPAAGSTPSIVVPDFSAVSAPNDFTVVAGVKFLTAFTTGSALAGMGTAIKPNEWYIQSVSQDLSIVELNTAVGVYRETGRPTGGGSPILMGGWHLLVVRFENGQAIEFSLDGTDPYTSGVSTSGPTGTRQGNTSSDLWIGFTDGTMSGGADATHARSLSNVAIYDYILDATDVGNLWTVFQSDGWV